MDLLAVAWSSQNPGSAVRFWSSALRACLASMSKELLKIVQLGGSLLEARLQIVELFGHR
jgi:hypothetical protein